MATISVPSREPLQRIMSPTPRPKIIPPKTALKKGSVVTGVMALRYAENKATHPTATIVAMVKLLPICLYPKYKNGKLITTKNSPKGITNDGIVSSFYKQAFVYELDDGTFEWEDIEDGMEPAF